MWLAHFNIFKSLKRRLKNAAGETEKEPESSHSNNIQDRFLLSSRASSSSLTPLSSLSDCLPELCVCLFPPSAEAGKLDNEWQNRWTQQCQPFPRLEWLLLTNRRSSSPTMRCRGKRRGRRGVAVGRCLQHPRHAYSTCTGTHTRTLTHTLHGLKGLPLCGRWINEGWEAEQWSYTMGGWGGQLQCEAWCYYGPRQQWRTPGYRAPQSLSSLCLELWGGWRWWWQEGFQLKEKLKAGWKTAVAFKRVQEEREECGCAEREKKTSVWGARDIKKFYVPVSMRRGPAQHCCGTLKADDSEAQIFAFLSFIWLCSTCRGSHLLKKSNILQYPKWHKNLPTFSCTLV